MNDESYWIVSESEVLDEADIILLRKHNIQPTDKRARSIVLIGRLQTVLTSAVKDERAVRFFIDGHMGPETLRRIDLAGESVKITGELKRIVDEWRERVKWTKA